MILAIYQPTMDSHYIFITILGFKQNSNLRQTDRIARLKKNQIWSQVVLCSSRI